MTTIDERAYWDKRERELTEVPEEVRGLAKIKALEVRIAAMESDRGAISEEQINSVKAELATLRGAKLTADDVVSRWAPIMGKTVAELKVLGNRWVYSRWDSLPASKFSSPQAHEQFCGFMCDYGRTV